MSKFFLYLIVFLPIFLFGNLSSSRYISVYKSIGGFSQINTYFYQDNMYKIFLSDLIVSSDENHRFFIPNFTKKIEVSYLRDGSIGWMDAFISIGHKPNLIAPNGDDLSNGNYTVSLNKYGTNYVDQVNRVNFYYTSSYNNEWTDYLLDKDPSWTLRYWNLRGIYLNADLDSIQMKNLNKWVYFAIDNRPSNRLQNNEYPRDGANLIRGLLPAYIYYLDKTLVDNLVQENALNEKFKNQCAYLENSDYKNAINACYYIKSFGSDGDDDDFSTHTKTLQGHEDNLGTIRQVPANLNAGWNMVGPYSSGMSIDASKHILSFDASSQSYNSFDTMISSSSINYLSKGNGAFIRVVNTAQTINIPVNEKVNEGVITSLKKGWNLLTVTLENGIQVENLKSVSNCIQAIYSFQNLNWLSYDFEIPNQSQVHLQKGNSFWVKTNGSCDLRH